MLDVGLGGKQAPSLASPLTGNLTVGVPGYTGPSVVEQAAATETLPGLVAEGARRADVGGDGPLLEGSVVVVVGERGRQVRRGSLAELVRVRVGLRGEQARRAVDGTAPREIAGPVDQVLVDHVHLLDLAIEPQVALGAELERVVGETGAGVAGEDGARVEVGETVALLAGADFRRAVAETRLPGGSERVVAGVLLEEALSSQDYVRVLGRLDALVVAGWRGGQQAVQVGAHQATDGRIGAGDQLLALLVLLDGRVGRPADGVLDGGRIEAHHLKVAQHVLLAPDESARVALARRLQVLADCG